MTEKSEYIYSFLVYIQMQIPTKKGKYLIKLKWQGNRE